MLFWATPADKICMDLIIEEVQAHHVKQVAALICVPAQLG